MLAWIILINAGSYLVFLSYSDYVIHAVEKNPANNLERLYYVIYVFSTLGNGEFSPSTGFAKIYTSLLSLTGFIVLTSAITYLLSVTSAALNKKQVASYLSTMATDPVALYHFSMIKENGRMLLEKSDKIVEMILSHANHQLSFPIIHFFITNNRQRALSIYVAMLFETAESLKQKFSSDQEVQVHCNTILKAISYLLSTVDINKDVRQKHIHLNETRIAWIEELHFHNNNFRNSHTSEKLSSYLASQGWEWRDVYNNNRHHP